jgi:hypothetical protein
VAADTQFPAMLIAYQATGGGWLANNWWWLVAGILIAGAVVLISFLARYLRIAINLFLDTPLPVTANLTDFTPPEGEIVSFPSLEGRSLRGMFIDRRPGLPDKGTVIFCHEFASDMMSAGRYAWPLVQAGYTVFTFDFRGHGRSFTPPHFEPRHERHGRGHPGDQPRGQRRRRSRGHQPLGPVHGG